MEPVCRRTRRRTEEALIRRYNEYKKAKTEGDRKEDEGSSAFATPSPVLEVVKTGDDVSVLAPENPDGCKSPATSGEDDFGDSDFTMEEAEEEEEEEEEEEVKVEEEAEEEVKEEEEDDEKKEMEFDFVESVEEGGEVVDDKQIDGDGDGVDDADDGDDGDDGDDDDTDDDDDDEKEGGGGGGGRMVADKNQLSADEIHGVLFSSVLEEPKTPDFPDDETDDNTSSSYSASSDAKDPLQEEIDSLYRMADFCLIDIAANQPPPPKEDQVVPTRNRKPVCNHELYLDEEVGMICILCGHVQTEIRDVTPEFHWNIYGDRERSPRYDKYNGYREAKNLPSFEDPKIDYQHSKEEAEFDPAGTVWEIIPELRGTLFRHQREAFGFIWRNVGGGTSIKELTDRKKSDGGGDGGGCLISHAPGTGKTRLAIAFLETHMKLYKNTMPIIIAPASILLTWKKEFERWKVEIPFLNLNDKELSEKELAMASSLFGESYEKNLTNMAKRLIKLLFWRRYESVLAVSYTLFTQLAGGEEFKKRGRPTKKKKTFVAERERLREMLLEKPGLLILDEGHMPRNERSCMFNVLSKVKTKKRIILSGTPFQNNFRELHNILCLVREEFTEFNNPFKSNTVDESDEANIREFKEKIKPFYHRYDGEIVKATVPGLIDSTIYLEPSELQKKVLEEEKEKMKSHLETNVNMNLISVHPLLLQFKNTNPDFKKAIKKWDFADGAKTRFLIRLIELSSALEERVLVFSQYLQPLNFLKALLQSDEKFGWREGIEILFMSGNQDMETRKRSMDLFNKPSSEAKVMLASTKACSEGIELIGASRVVLLDVTWNPSVEKQAISRAYRMGQEKVVHVYHLIMTDNDSNRHFSQTKKNKFSKYMFSSSSGKEKNEVVSGSTKAVCEDVILDRLLEEKIINEAVQQKASGLHNEF